MKIRSDSTLAQLTEDQRDQLYDWLASDVSFRDAVARAALPPPEGFGIKTHVTTLTRFFTMERERRNAEQLLQTQTAEPLGANPGDLLTAAKMQLAHATFAMTQGPIAPQNFNNLSRAFYRLDLLAHRDRDHELEQKRLDLDTRKFEYNAVAAAVKHASELLVIAEDDSLNDLEKYKRARKVLFGHAIDGIEVKCPHAGPAVPADLNQSTNP